MRNKKCFFRENAANFITLCNMIAGATSILMSINGKFKTAMALVVISSIADRYDGKIARKLNLSSQLGVQMDSMGDILSFGVAPAILTYIYRIMPLDNSLRLLGGIATVFFICCGAFRLARFNIDGMDDDNNFSGMPIPVAGLSIIVLNMLGHNIGIIFLIISLFTLGILMVSRLKIKKK